MQAEWQEALTRFAGPVASLGVVAAVRRFRALSWRDDIGVRWPEPRAFGGWVLGYVAFATALEVASRALGEDVDSWSGKYPAAIAAMRALIIVLLAPVAEELVFRGLMFSVLSRTRLGGVGAVVVAAGVFAALHVQYGGIALALVLLDGLFFGAARLTTGSVLVPIVCHMLGNAFAVYQRLSPPS